jgi:hypothetical protein
MCLPILVGRCVGSGDFCTLLSSSFCFIIAIRSFTVIGADILRGVVACAA